MPIGRTLHLLTIPQTSAAFSAHLQTATAQLTIWIICPDLHLPATAHLAGLETIPVPAVGKDMFLVWDKAGTETIEGATREYKEGEIVDITELFGPTDYTRSDFSVLAYADDGFTKLRKLCDEDNDGDVDKQDTALSAEVAAKLKLWSPLSGELILFKDTDIVVDVRAGSYERHPSDVEGWAVEYKMKDNQDRLVGYQWLTSKTSSLLCVDVLLAIQ